MDGVDHERCSSRRRLNDDNHGNSCSYDAQIGAREFEEVEASSSASNSSSEDVAPPNNLALDAAEDCQAARIESSVDDHEVENTATPISSSDDQSSGMKRKKGNCQSTKVKQNANKMQWPKWTVTHLLSLSTMENVMNYYRALKLANNLSDKDLRCFLEEQVLMEKAGLSERTIEDRLKTKLHDSAAADEPDSCSICMGEYKEQEEIASLYYCSHVHHADCIKKWLPNNNLCPMCRALAIIPEEYPSWNGDVRLHQAFFVHLPYAT